MLFRSANLKRADIEFNVGDKVFLKISPWKGVIRFGKRGKLSPRFIGPYGVIERIESVAYRLALPPTLEGLCEDERCCILLFPSGKKG